MEQTNVFVKFLPQDMDDAGLHSLFAPFGTIVSAKVMVDQYSGESMGYGFVRFSNAKEAKKAIHGMTGYRINQKSLLCKYSNTTFPDPSSNIYIKPLPGDFSEEELIAVFGKYGGISSVRIVDAGGVSDSRIAFYDTVDSASMAIKETNGIRLQSHLPRLTVKYAESDLRRAIRKAPTDTPSQLIPSSNVHSTPLSPPQTILSPPPHPYASLVLPNSIPAHAIPLSPVPPNSILLSAVPHSHSPPYSSALTYNNEPQNYPSSLQYQPTNSPQHRNAQSYPPQASQVPTSSLVYPPSNSPPQYYPVANPSGMVVQYKVWYYVPLGTPANVPDDDNYYPYYPPQSSNNYGEESDNNLNVDSFNPHSGNSENANQRRSYHSNTANYNINKPRPNTYAADNPNYENGYKHNNNKYRTDNRNHGNYGSFGNVNTGHTSNGYKRNARHGRNSRNENNINSTPNTTCSNNNQQHHDTTTLTDADNDTEKSAKIESNGHTVTDNGINLVEEHHPEMVHQ